MQKKYLDGKTWFPLTVQKEILEMRKEIENNAQHTGQKFEIVLHAYNEIREAHGQAKSKYTASCSGCILVMNQIVINWFKLFDKMGASEQRVVKAPEFKPLKPVSRPDATPASANDPVKEPSYKELLERFNAEADAQEKEAILKGRKTPKKNELIQYFDGKQAKTTGTQE